MEGETPVERTESPRPARGRRRETIISESAAGTARVAAALAGRLPAGAVVALDGPLGAGKTVFAKGLARGLGFSPRAVRSPTFVIAMEHRREGGRPFFHLDCYRFGSAAELDTVPFDDYLAAGGVIVIEWAGKVRDRLPPGVITVCLRKRGRQRREIVISGI